MWISDSFCKIFCLSLVGVVLTGCGGGGGSNAPAAPVASTLSFPLLSAYQIFVANRWARSITISGDCSGSGTVSTDAANVAATFEGVVGFLASSKSTTSFANCTPANSVVTENRYYDSNYTPIGSNRLGEFYGVYLTPPTIPTYVTVGSASYIGRQTKYIDSSKTQYFSYEDISYVIEADTANSAIVNLKTKEYKFTTAWVLNRTVQDRYRITEGGVLTPISADVQYANGSTSHIVVIYNATIPVVTTPASPPVASNISFSGNWLTGQSLTGSYTYTDVNNDFEGASTFIWKRDGVAIPGATGINYTLTAADLNTIISFWVTPIAQNGTLLTGNQVYAYTTSPIKGGIVQGGLAWSNAKTGYIYNWTDANTYCTTSTINALTGWRLPTASELNSYMLSSISNGELYSTSEYWTSSISTFSNYHVSVYNFSSPLITDSPNSSLLYAVCVR